MTAAMTALARGAHKLYSDDPGTIGRLGDWFKLHFDIKVATSDKTIEDDDSLRFFEFEYLRWYQCGMSKCETASSPMRSAESTSPVIRRWRLIVNHVALKLYGI